MIWEWNVEQVLMVYFAAINAVTFLAFGIDKASARGGRRRTPEKTLWLFALLGGSLGALLAMNRFRHKTKKISFQLVIALILLLQASALLTLYYLFY